MFVHRDVIISSSITVDLVIFACLDFREFMILELFVESRIRALSISLIVAYYNNFRDIPKFANLSSSRNFRKLKPREHYQIYSIINEQSHSTFYCSALCCI